MTRRSQVTETTHNRHISQQNKQSQSISDSYICISPPPQSWDEHRTVWRHRPQTAQSLLLLPKTTIHVWPGTDLRES